VLLRAGVAAGPPSPVRCAGRTGVPERAGVPAQRRYDGGPAATPAGRAVPGASADHAPPHVGSVASGRRAECGAGGRAAVRWPLAAACDHAGLPAGSMQERRHAR